ncbi:hypothetical protein [Aeromonas enteropelogenes]|uniref:hypothetical protein n=1 Tax=Aeromonas enteropelogenes TaxID=29489 RepID=UPI003BA015C5
MTDTVIKSAGRPWFNGTFGNASVSPTLTATLDAIVSGDTIIFDNNVEPNISIYGVTLVSTGAGLPAGAAVTVKVGETVIANTVPLEGEQAVYQPVIDLLTEEGMKVSVVVGDAPASAAAPEGGESAPVPRAAAAPVVLKVKLHYEMIGNI